MRPRKLGGFVSARSFLLSWSIAKGRACLSFPMLQEKRVNQRDDFSFSVDLAALSVSDGHLAAGYGWEWLDRAFDLYSPII
jgi:hypothetical protein